MEPINTAPALPGEEQTEPIVCMYMENCDTGSQLRKAISHIFGRNKLCTRQIPAHVWVHYCRKHYQRSRYRNAQDYSKLQIELVQKQIQRVQEWSDANKAAGRDGVVTDWSLAIRKREQKRLEDQVSKKRPFRATADDSDDDAGDFGGGKNRNPVPDWLLEKCGTGYSTEEIERIVGLLRDKIVSGQLSQIPDIEILPTITSDPVDENNRPKAYHKRKSSAVTAAAVAAAATHKRSHSINVGALRSEAAPIMIRRVSQPSFWTGGEQSPEQKRQRTSSSEFGSSDYYHDDQQRQTLPPFGMRRMHQLPHRPAFGNIRESQSEDVYNHQQQPLPSFLQQRSHSYSAASGSPGGPGPLLPAPIPQRYGTGLADQLESQQHASCGYSSGGSGGYDQQQRRPAHQRSHSEVGSFSFNFGSSSSGYRPSSSSGFQPINGPPPPPPPPPPASYSSGPLPRLENPFASTTPTSSAPYGSSAATATNNSLHVRRLSHQGPDYSPPTNYPAQQHHLNPPSTAASGFGATRHARHQSSPSVPRLHQLQQHHYGSVPGTSGSVMTTAATAPTLPPISSYGSGNNNSSGFSFRPRSPLEPALSPFDQSRHNHHHHHHSTSSVSSITSNHHQQHSRRPSYAAAGGHGQAGAYPPPSVAEEEDGCCEDPPQQQQQQRDVVMLPPLQPQGQIQEL